MTKAEQYLSKLKPWIEALDRKLGQVSFKDIARFQEEIDSVPLKKLISEITGVEVDKLTVADVYDIYFALQTEAEDPFVSFKFANSAIGILKIPYMPKDKWQSWVETLYCRLPQSDQQKASKIAGGNGDYRKLLQAIKQVEQGGN